MTPRQMMAWSILAEQSIGKEKAVDLKLNSLASHGDIRTLNEVHDMLLNER